MGWMKLYKSRKYLQSILLSIMFMMLIFLITASYTLFRFADKTVLENQFAADQKLLTQINYNLSYMNVIVKNVATSIFYDDDLTPFLYSSTQEDIIRKISKLSKIVSSFDFLNSMVFYNGVNDTFYSDSVYNYDIPNEVIFTKLKKFLSIPSKVAKMELIPFQYSTDTVKQTLNVFSYFMFNSLDQYKLGESVLILNVKPEWIFESIKRINDLDISDQSSVFVINDKAEVILEDSKHSQLYSEASQLIPIRQKQSGKAVDSFSHIIQGEKYLISYMTMEVNHWKVISLQPYSVVTNKTKQLRETSIIVTLGFLILSVLMSYFVARKLYQPIEKLLKFVMLKNGGENEGQVKEMDTKDELAFVERNYDHILTRFQLLEQTQDTTQTILTNYRLSLLITDSSGFKQEEIQELTHHYRLKLHLDEKLIVCILKIDNYQEFIDNIPPTGRQLYYFSILNITKEFLDQSFICESVNMRRDHLVMLINVRNNKEDYVQITKILMEAREVVQQYYKISFSAALSNVVEDYRNITLQYQTALQYSLYRVVYGKGSVIVPQMVAEQVSNHEFYTPKELESKLMNAIKAGDLAEMHELMESFMKDIAKYDYDNIMNAILHLIGLIKQTINVININKPLPITVDFYDLNRKVMEKETLDEITILLNNMITDISEQNNGVKGERSSVVLQTIKDIISVSYINPDLNVQSISALLKMSPVYVGRMFKAAESISIVDYMNEIRLTQALGLLRTTELSAKEIMLKVGFGNQSYFFRLFKQKYGVTPMEYRLKMSMKL